MSAVKRMQEGKKIRRPTFHQFNYLYFENHILKSGMTKEKAYLVEKHFEADDWEIVEEKKALSYFYCEGDCKGCYCNHYPAGIVKKAINEFIESLREYHSSQGMDFVRIKAKEIFGENLL